MHTRGARKLGENDERMHLLNAWRETPIYSARERAALAWTEAVTLISENHVPDRVYVRARLQFSEKELVDLTAAVVAINGWNRAAIAFRAAAQVTGSKGPLRFPVRGAPIRDCAPARSVRAWPLLTTAFDALR